MNERQIVQINHLPLMSYYWLHDLEMIYIYIIPTVSFGKMKHVDNIYMGLYHSLSQM